MLYSAVTATASGIQAASTLLDVTSNNVANSDTPGFKIGQATFQDLLYTNLNPANGANQPEGTQLGSGAQLNAITSQFNQGSLVASGGKYDLGINGQGFFKVILPDGTAGYTRAGNFVTDNTGQLVTPQGYRLDSNVIIPPNTASISLGPDGSVTAVNSNGTTQVVGQVELTRFVNPAGLSRFGDNVFTETAASGAAVTGAPDTNGLGTVTSGVLEQSNVDLTSELVNLIVAQQTYQYNTQALQVESETLQDTTALIT